LNSLITFEFLQGSYHISKTVISKSVLGNIKMKKLKEDLYNFDSRLRH
jgi:hypothetical protein